MSTYTDTKTLEFTLELAANIFTYYSSMCIVLPIIIKKSRDKDTNIDGTIRTVNNFICQWLKKNDARRYPSDARILPTNNTVEIYQYASPQSKYFPAKSLDDTRETLLYEKTAVILTGKWGRRLNNANSINDRTNSNLGTRITDLHDLISAKTEYRIPLAVFTILRLLNFQHKIDTRFLFTLETNINKLSKPNTKIDNIPYKNDKIKQGLTKEKEDYKLIWDVVKVTPTN